MLFGPGAVTLASPAGQERATATDKPLGRPPEWRGGPLGQANLSAGLLRALGAKPLPGLAPGPRTLF